MSWHFRKSKQKGIFRATASKSGISTSVGGKGVRLTRTANGKLKLTTGIPGTGIYHTQTIGETGKSRKSGGKTSTVVIIVLIVLIVAVIFLTHPRQGTIPEPPETTNVESPQEAIPPFAFVDDIASVFLSANGSEKIGCEINEVDTSSIEILNENPDIAEVSVDKATDEGIVIKVTAVSAGVGFFSLTDGTNSSDRICVVVDGAGDSSSGGTYILNVKTHVYHRSSCSNLPDTDNRQSISYSEAVSGGYSPCKICNP